MSTPTRTELKKNLRALHKRLQDRPMDLDARMRVARTYRLLRRAEEAVAHYAAVARYLSLAGHPTQAIAVLKELLQLDPKHEESLLFLAKLYARTRAGEAQGRARVAIPIGAGPEQEEVIETLEGGLPQSGTGIWRAISSIPRPANAPNGHVESKEIRDLAEHEPEENEVDEADVIESEDIAVVIEESSGAPRTSSPAQDSSRAERSSASEVRIPPLRVEELLPHEPPFSTLFASLEPDAFHQLSHAMVFQTAPAGEVIFREGEPGDSCIIVSRGHARISRRLRGSARRSTPSGKGAAGVGQEVVLAELSAGDIAGIAALMAAQVRQATLTAATEFAFFEVDRLALDELVQRHPEIKAKLTALYRQRLLVSLLSTLPFFRDIDASERNDIIARFQDREFSAGDELFFEGAEMDGLWVILTGAVLVKGGVEGHLPTELREGDYVGSLAQVHSGQADLGAVARSPTMAAVLTHKQLAAVLARHAEVDVRARFEAAGMMIGRHVFAGSASGGG